MVMVGVWKLSFLNDKYKHRIGTKIFYTTSVTVSSLSGAYTVLITIRKYACRACPSGVFTKCLVLDNDVTVLGDIISMLHKTWILVQRIIVVIQCLGNRISKGELSETSRAQNEKSK